MRLAALLCHCRSWIQGSRFREQLFRFGGSIPEFPDENPLGDPQRANPVATMSPANCLRASAGDRTILGASFVHSLIAPQVANRTSGLLAATNVLVGGSFDWIISAGVISRALRDWRCRCPKCRSQRQTNQENECARSTGKAGSGNRTRMASLEGWNFTIKLCPRDK
jgi:hypothetical protein